MSWGRKEGTGRSGNLFSHILPQEIRNGCVGRMAAGGILVGRMVAAGILVYSWEEWRLLVYSWEEWRLLVYSCVS